MRTLEFGAVKLNGPAKCVLESKYLAGEQMSERAGGRAGPGGLKGRCRDSWLIESEYISLLWVHTRSSLRSYLFEPPLRMSQVESAVKTPCLSSPP